MRVNFRAANLTAALVVSTAAILIAAEDRIGQPGGFTVHEWGTLTSVAGEDGNAVEWDVLGGKDDLPHFVNDYGYRCFKFRLSGTVRMETPVLYFYSPRAMEARVRVAFPQGLITEWYPQADHQVDQKSRDGRILRLSGNLNGLDTSMRNQTGGIEWKNVRIEPGTSPTLPVEADPSRYYAARATDAVPVTVGNQHEKFLFYRGVGRIAVPLAARASSDGKVVVGNRGADPAPMVMLFENRGGRIGYRSAGAVSDSVTLERPSLDAGLGELRADLERSLMAEGLFPKEAHAMVETWRDSWFEEGSRLIYILPARAVDRILPLEVEPAPDATIRVFVGRIELITPETVAAVAQAVRANDRSVADRYGRFLNPILNRIAQLNLADAAAIQRCRASLQLGGGCRR